MGRNMSGPGPVQQHRPEASAQVQRRHEHRKFSIPEHRSHHVSGPHALPTRRDHRPAGGADVGLMSTGTYLVLTVQRPVIVCPSWWSATEARHVDELASLDCGVMHIGVSVPMLADGSLRSIRSPPSWLTGRLTLKIQSFESGSSCSATRPHTCRGRHHCGPARQISALATRRVMSSRPNIG